MRLAEFVTRSIDNSANGVSVKAAMEKLGLRNKRDLLPGMEVRLLPHQILGVAWMMNQERVSPHKGGILADEMGLGKTVQMIATMAINLPEPEDKHRTTLVVVPAALLQQWKDELLTKTNGIFSVHIHHGKDKLKSVSALSKKDVIITTYHTLCGDFTIPSGIESEDEMEYLMDNGGLLSQMKWYRVIADESQFIRNRRTRSSKAVAMLRAKYRWCLTGTPVTNTLADIYGFLRFGRFRPWNVWKDFNEYIAKEQLRDAPLAGLRAQEILKPLLLRRTKDAEIEGEPLLQLPEKHIELEYLEFSDEERQLYDSFEGRAQTQINRFLRDGSLLKNTSVVLVMILRLRQLSCHPHLILEQAQGFEDPTMLVASDAEKEVARASKLMGPEWVTQVGRILNHDRFMARARMAQLDFSDDMEQDEEATCPRCGDFFMEGSGRLLACGHELCNDCLLALRTERMEVNEEFGNGDEKENMRVEKEFEAAALKGLRPCPTCKKMQDLSPAHVFLSQAFEPLRDDVRAANRRSRAARRAVSQPMSRVVKKEPIIIDSDLEMSSSSDEDMPDLSELLAGAASSSQSSSEKKKESKAKVKGRTVMSDDDDSPMDEDNDLHNTMDKIRGKRVQKSKAPADDDSDDDGPRQVPAYMVNTWRRGDDNLEPSTKMMALINHLQEWEVTGDKTIVYSQWTSMLDLIETLFQRYGIRSLRYDGKMSRDARELVLSEFRQRGGPKVILISIKCGGVGLNLVSANRIINMDLSWNYASESQAYDRVHRLGQEKEVFIKRLIVKNTIEERMLRLQDTKTGLAEAALGEGSGVKLHKLSVKELKAVRFSSLRVLVYALTRSCVKLFGMNKDNRPQAGQQTLDDNQQQ
ncbi:SNF2 family N-terminal domain-containing protein [Rhodofomes roseus]|uniref:SNF2 family N-terminal domain-containing protein n=1 Tax=Rhodofomes roseus TaxID=34475 RepID=A0ABQ8KJI3_9APHY|nr:SNF2 family N-terminal domain-containing protein [Rhodofomes roseus]KAH9837668.1 SNF2 family N-terminal domain-containing protein [Rhodofomes roseus]